jgi:acyl-CoA reductase-like NAD-dependent aldehyde dehydrogenase
MIRGKQPSGRAILIIRVCLTIKRLYEEEDIFADLVEKSKEKMKKLSPHAADRQIPWLQHKVRKTTVKKSSSESA